MAEDDSENKIQSHNKESGSGSTNVVVQESHNQRLTSLLLNGRNFLPWSRAVTIALGGRSRLGHINGHTKAPPETSPTFEEWQAHDHNVMSWLFNSIEPDVYEIFAYSDSAQELWEALSEMYGQAKNASRIFELQQGLASIKQGGNQNFTEHLGKMKKQWDELRQYRPATKDVSDYAKREEQDRIFQLLASLKPDFEETRREILQRPEIPPFNTVCSIIQSEETRRRVMRSKSDSPDSHVVLLESSAHHVKEYPGMRPFKEKSNRPRFTCEHCRRDGHTKERCWNLYPHLRQNKKGLAAKTVTSDSNQNLQAKLEFLATQVQ